MSSQIPSTRPIDHLVLPTAGLDGARARLGALGFTVAPEGVHPFGTANACVYFGDGTFLEPLAVADPCACETAAAEGNVFVARDHAFRAVFGDEGMSALVLATADAAADHARFLEAERAAGAILSFARPFRDADGRSDVASFRLAFAAAPDTVPFFFTCERVAAPAVDRSALERHANGVSGISAVEIVAADPAMTAGLVALATGAEGRAQGAGVRFALPHADLIVRDPSAGETPAPGAAFAFGAVTFAVPDLAAVRSLLEGNGIAFEADRARLTVAAAAGQGATFVFEERR